jgi:hypothetical protein
LLNVHNIDACACAVKAVAGYEQVEQALAARTA